MVAFNGIVREAPVGCRSLTRGKAYGSMMCQVARDYSGIADVLKLKCSEIRYFYNYLRPELERQRQRQQQNG